MNLVDSSAWLEYFANGPNAGFFSKPIEDSAQLLVSTINIYEVFKRITQEKSETDALQAVVSMQQGTIVDVTSTVVLEAARLSIAEGLAMADAMLYATARLAGATLWTQDADFEHKPCVEYRPKQRE